MGSDPLIDEIPVFTMTEDVSKHYDTRAAMSLYSKVNVSKQTNKQTNKQIQCILE